MKILRTYILKETVGPFTLSLVVLTSIMLLGNLVKMVNLVINKGVDIVLVFKSFLYLIPFLLAYTIPIACLSAVLLTFGRLSSDNEIIAIRTSGISIFKLILPLIISGLILSLILVVLNDRVIPYSHYASRKTIKQIGIRNPAAVLEAGTFIDSFQGSILFIYRIKGNKLYQIRIYQPQGEGKPTRTIVAKTGEFIAIPEENKIKLKLMDGTSDEADINNPEVFYKLNFKTYFMTLDLVKTDTGEIKKKPKDMTLKELQKEIKKMQELSIDATPLTTEYHKKISLSFSCLVFILLGFPLAIMIHKRGKSANFALAFLVVVIYYLLLIGFEALSRQGLLTPILAMWAPNIILGLLASILNYRLCVS
jgi:lipopolysaccharide export system permease protein